MERISTALLASIMMLLAFLAGCTPNQSNLTGSIAQNEGRYHNADPVRIGGLFGLTGFASFAGQASREGFIMALEDSNYSNYAIEDFGSDYRNTVTAATRLIEIESTPVIIGPEWEFGQAIIELAGSSDTLFISPWMAMEAPWAVDEHYLTGTPSDRRQTQALIRYMRDHGVRTISLVYANNAWSTVHSEIFRQELASLGGVRLMSESQVEEGATDFRSQLTRVLSERPDAVYAVLPTDESQGAFNRQYHEIGVESQLYIPFARAESEGLLGQFGQYSQGIIYPASQEWNRTSEFNSRFSRRFGHQPGAISAAVAYDMTTLVVRAIRAGARTGPEIREYLSRTQDYDGYSNWITFEENGMVRAGAAEIRQIDSRTPKVIDRE